MLRFCLPGSVGSAEGQGPSAVAWSPPGVCHHPAGAGGICLHSQQKFHCGFHTAGRGAASPPLPLPPYWRTAPLLLPPRSLACRGFAPPGHRRNVAVTSAAACGCSIAAPLGKHTPGKLHSQPKPGTAFKNDCLPSFMYAWAPPERASPACIPAMSPKQPSAKGRGFGSVSRAV